MATKVLFKGYSSKTSVRKLKDMDLAKQDLTNHFNTKKGERLMEPSYGSLVWDLMFEPYDDTVEDAVKEDCIDIVSQDPRWNLREVVTYSNQNAISIQMRLKYTPTDQEDILFINFDRNLSEAK
jgi:phage baseplate assembly protein W|tara:strand:- start:10425 stop:10796 length:372 start_codon:yes stop_codon:yes gene_type:complete